jgi:hypothetical protein
MTTSRETSSVSGAAIRDRYLTSGYVVLRRFFDTPTMELLDQEAQQLLADPRGLISPCNLRCRYMRHHASDEQLFECFDPITDIAPRMEKVARDQRLLNVLATLYGQSAHLFKDKLIFKPSGAVGYPLHQDYIAWPDFPKSFLTVLIPLDASTEENGCTTVYEGYHHNGLLTPADGKFHTVPRELVDESRRIALVLEPGDVAIFDGFTPHESNPNRSDASRRQLYLSYNANHDGRDQRDAHYRHFHAWMQEKYPTPPEGSWYFA